ncbi:lactose synthase [Trifolium repens]|nr:lactose synthase [Trifolium repens]
MALMRCGPLRCFHEALLEEEVDQVEGLFTLQFGLHLSQEKLPICRKVEKRKGYSIVMNTWKRYDLLKQSIKHYSSCPRLESEDILNNRFKEIKDLETDAIFSIADDVIFPCPLVEFAFDVWQSAPDAMVGFVPRVHWVDSLN